MLFGIFAISFFAAPWLYTRYRYKQQAQARLDTLNQRTTQAIGYNPELTLHRRANALTRGLTTQTPNPEPQAALPPPNPELVEDEITPHLKRAEHFLNTPGLDAEEKHDLNVLIQELLSIRTLKASVGEHILKDVGVQDKLQEKLDALTNVLNQYETAAADAIKKSLSIDTAFIEDKYGK